MFPSDDISWLSRTRLLVKDEGLERLAKAHVLIVGLGGIGSFAAEFIARAGIGKMTIVDGDVVDRSNRNRQIPALYTTEGQSKADVMKERLKAIHPSLELVVVNRFMEMTDLEKLLETPFDYVIDAIDSLTPKVHLLATCYHRGIPVVGCMGAGGRMNPADVRLDDISETRICPLARYTRKRLKDAGVRKGIRVVYSSEVPMASSLVMTNGLNYKKSAYGTISYMPALFGLYASSEVIRNISGVEQGLNEEK